jgi:hypothetical protein
MTMEELGVWIAAFLTLCIFSFLYKDNPFYKFAEHLFVGISAGYWFARIYQSILKVKCFQPLWEEFNYRMGNVPELAGEADFTRLLLILPFLLGILILLRLVPKVAWMSRWPLAFIIGAGAGINFILYMRSNALNQIQNTLLPVVPGEDVSLWLALSNLVLILGVITGLFYFFFSQAHTGAFGVAARVGVYFLMISFGAAFGYTVMARISLLIGRFQFLLGDWLGIIKV